MLKALNEELKAGYRGTSDTIDRMHKLAERGKLDTDIQKIATWIRLQVGGDQRAGSRKLADAVFRWVQQHGIFQRDPFQIEKIEDLKASMAPIVQAREAGIYDGPGLFVGDCDTFSIWVAALGGVLGFQYAFETGKFDVRRPDEFSHVWTALLVDKEWVSYDASTPSASPGWRPPADGTRFKRWPEKPIDEVVGMSSLNGSMNGRHNSSTDGWTAPFRPYGTRIEEAGYVENGPFHDFGGPGLVPEMTAGQLDTLVPDEPAVPGSDIAIRKGDWTQRIEPPKPQGPPEKPMVNEMVPSQYPRPTRWPRGAYIQTQQPYPADSPWARQVEIAFQEEGQMIYGMGDEPASVATQAAPQQAATQQVVQDNIWSTITSAISAAAAAYPTVSAMQLEQQKLKAAQDLARAQANVSSQYGLPPSTLPPPIRPSAGIPTPVLIGAGLLLAGGAAYLIFRK